MLSLIFLVETTETEELDGGNGGYGNKIDEFQFGIDRVFAVAPDGDAHFGSFVHSQIEFVPFEHQFVGVRLVIGVVLEVNHFRSRHRGLCDATQTIQQPQTTSLDIIRLETKSCRIL